MTHTKRSCVLGLLISLGLALGERSAVAQTSALVFSSYSHVKSPYGDCIYGADSGACSPSPTSQWIAAPFVPMGSGPLDFLYVAAVYLSGTEGIVVTLVNDNDGSPGPVTTVLESFVTQHLGSPAKPTVKLTSTLHPTLTAGTQYWLVVAPLGYNSLATWNLSDTRTAVPDISFDGGKTWASFDSFYGGVPTPPFTNLPEFAVYVE